MSARHDWRKLIITRNMERGLRTGREDGRRIGCHVAVLCHSPWARWGRVLLRVAAVHLCGRVATIAGEKLPAPRRASRPLAVGWLKLSLASDSEAGVVDFFDISGELFGNYH